MEQHLQTILKSMDVPKKFSRAFSDLLIIEYTPQQLERLAGELQFGQLTSTYELDFHRKMFGLAQELLGDRPTRKLTQADALLGLFAARQARKLPELNEQMAWFNKMVRWYKTQKLLLLSIDIFAEIVPVLSNQHRTYDQEFLYFLNRYASVLGKLRNWQQQIEVLQTIHQYELAVAGEWHSDSVRTLRSLILACRCAADYPKEREYLLVYLDLLMFIIANPDESQIPEVLEQIAVTYSMQHELEQATNFFQDWQTRFESSYGYDHPYTAKLLSKAAQFYHEIGDEETGQIYDERLVHLWLRRVHNASVARPYSAIRHLNEMYELANVYREQMRNDDALHVLYEATTRCEEQWGTTHYETVRANVKVVKHMLETDHPNFLPVLLIVQDMMKDNLKPYGRLYNQVYRMLIRYYEKQNDFDKLFETFQSMLTAHIELLVWEGVDYDHELLEAFGRMAVHTQKIKEAHVFLGNCYQLAKRLQASEDALKGILFIRFRMLINMRTPEARFLNAKSASVMMNQLRGLFIFFRKNIGAHADKLKVIENWMELVRDSVVENKDDLFDDEDD